jgi:hypothetical protein
MHAEESLGGILGAQLSVPEPPIAAGEPQCLLLSLPESHAAPISSASPAKLARGQEPTQLPDTPRHGAALFLHLQCGVSSRPYRAKVLAQDEFSPAMQSNFSARRELPPVPQDLLRRLRLLPH